MKRIQEASVIRKNLIDATKKCQICGTNETRRKYSFAPYNQLCCHEILNGPLRTKVLDEPSFLTCYAGIAINMK